jgi:CubicO group peptidase (beta-lactamase class C family)
MNHRIFTGHCGRWPASTLVLGLALLLAPVVSWAQKPGIERAQTVLAVHGKYIDERIAEFMTRNSVPGLSMAIVQAPYIPRSAGYGRASVVNDQLASTRTMWNIGPITQAFTATAVFQLYEAKKLDIHDPIGKYVPDIPETWRRITIFELLQHASGIPDYRSSPKFNETKTYRPAELLAMVSGQPLLFASGSQVRMSATDFALLGLAIEHASGMSYHDYLTKFQIERLGLHSTMFAEDFATRSSTDRPAIETEENKHFHFKSEIPFIDPVEPAIGYKEQDGKFIAVDPKSSETLFAFGSLWSSAEDISFWDIGLAGSILVQSAANRALIYQPTRLENGMVVPAMAGWEFTSSGLHGGEGQRARI